MKCCTCGLEFNTYNNKCPRCGTITNAPPKERSRLANLLDRQLPQTNLYLTYMNLILILLVNCAIFAVVGNCVLFACGVSEVVWAHFVVCGLLAAYILLRSVYTARRKVFGYIRTAMYTLLIALTVTQFLSVTTYDTSMWVSGIVTPAVVTLLSCAAFLLYLLAKISVWDFLATAGMNLLIMVYPMVLMLAFPAQFKFMDYEMVFVYVAFGVTLLLLVNFLFIRSLSLFTKVRKTF